MLTDGNQENPRRIYCKADKGNITSIQAGECIPFGFHPFIKESEYYPSHNATDFYHCYKAVSYTHLPSREKSIVEQIDAQASIFNEYNQNLASIVLEFLEKINNLQDLGKSDIIMIEKLKALVLND